MKEDIDILAKIANLSVVQRQNPNAVEKFYPEIYNEAVGHFGTWEKALYKP